MERAAGRTEFAKKKVVYVETSVVSLLAARPSGDYRTRGNQETTELWWKDANERFELIASKRVLYEPRAGDAHAAQRRLAFLETIKVVDSPVASGRLCDALLEAGVVPRGAVTDAGHIADAATLGVDFLVTWNFRHIANAAMRERIEGLCQIAGYPAPIICTPYELLEVNRHELHDMPILSDLWALRRASAA
ncbi:MAG: type II toxin-antitoxin system VapC family toxin [Gammaproteobacteria bacterium]|nr:type II toxin-antitoxin system VapC family toxin [Gammaproteobacteria bacterium]